MFRKIPFSLLLCTFISVFSVICFAEIDKSRYITIDEIKPGMDAYCLTVYQGVEPAKYNLKVVSVVRNATPNKDLILVIGTDEAFIHSGAVAGCSGSPVYINGRLAGALSSGWACGKDPLYGVTPIKEMLEVGTHQFLTDASACSALDFTKPISLKESYKQLMARKPTQQLSGGMTNLAYPITTNLPQSSFSNFSGVFESTGFIPVAAGSASGAADSAEYNDVSLKPGGILALPLVSGDIDISAIGTVTEVADGKVYAFGHSMLGQGPIDLPMATGRVHTVVASIVQSFKLCQPLEIKGALYADESSAVVGSIGRQAATIPIHIKVDRFNDKVREYDCKVAVHQFFTPMLAGACIGGAATMLGDLPAENAVEYKARIGITGYDAIEFKNFSSSNDIQDFLSDAVGALNIIMNNPYDRPQITSLDFEIKITPRNMVSHIWSFELSQTEVKPGQTVTATITIETFLGKNETYKTDFTIPSDTPSGIYTLTAGGFEEYMMFLNRFAPYKFMPENFPGMIKAVNEIGNIKRNSLYVMLGLPASGIAIENSSLPNLPVTKSLLLKNDKRTLSVQPGAEWIERIIPVETVVLDSKEIMIKVEKDRTDTETY
ncbi:MAG: hypothetical protein LLF92_00295 [Planctomycetaceae bacterium]|nr:hypothetical protein [Planctomycetaceae bacterium]